MSGKFAKFVQTGNLVFVSGHIANRDGEPWRGRLGVDLTTEQGQEAAAGVARDLIDTLHEATGDLDRGAHARSAFGVAALPLGVCVEIELVAELAW